MRPTTAFDDNVFDLNSLLHPGTMFEHPRDVVSHPNLSLAEKRAILAYVVPGGPGSRSWKRFARWMAARGIPPAAGRCGFDRSSGALRPDRRDRHGQGNVPSERYLRPGYPPSAPGAGSGLEGSEARQKKVDRQWRAGRRSAAGATLAQTSLKIMPYHV
jgi:hypothetical protein